MTEGVLVEWLVSDGDTIARGAPVYSLEVEKALQEIEAPLSGRIRLLVKAGESYAVGTIVAIIE